MVVTDYRWSNFEKMMENETEVIKCENKLSRVLVIYTGGTIGMKKNKDNAYAVVPNYFAEALKKLPMLYDSEYAGVGMPDVASDTNIYSKYHQLAMPLSKMGVRIMYYVKELDPILDSSNMSMQHWSLIAKEVKDHYEYFDSFVILHGTDTMAYTASALSYMFENLDKTVIITGSQIPIFEHRSDGQGNFVGALEIAGHFVIPEVTLFFNNKLFRGNRCQKVSSSDIDAFDSPNIQPIARLGTEIEINWSSVLTTSTLPFSVQESMSENVGILRLFPGISSQIVKAVLSAPMEGIVIESFGAGNVPSDRPDLMEEFRTAAKRGVILLNITQCYKGSVSDAYAAGKVLFDIGVIPGLDMTPEAALTKMAYVLGKKEMTHEQRRYILSKNIRGEMSSQYLKSQTVCFEEKLKKTVTDSDNIQSHLDMNCLQRALYPLLLVSAAKHCDIDTIKTLVQQGADLNEPSPYDGKIALHQACAQGHVSVAKYLLENGSSVLARDLQGCTPLSYAVQYKQIKIVKLLLDTGTPFDCDDFDVARELCSAVVKNDMEYLQLLKKANVNLNVTDMDGRTPLHVAVSKRNIDAIKLLVNDSNLFAKDATGHTALENAKRLSFYEVVNILNQVSKNEINEVIFNNNNNSVNTHNSSNTNIQRINCKMNCGG